jgi:hypothetical protein
MLQGKQVCFAIALHLDGFAVAAYLDGACIKAYD